jgi:hypothetical protein
MSNNLTTVIRLFGLVWPLAFAQSDPWAAAVLVDEFDAGQLQGPPNRQVVSRRHGRLAVGQLGPADGGDA